MTRTTTRTQRRLAKKRAQRFPVALTPVPRDQWPLLVTIPTPVALFHSREYLVQVFNEDNGVIRLSVCCTEISSAGYVDGLTWDELMHIKQGCGYGDRWAVEVYPDNREVVNVANMRHLWLLEDPPPYAWRKPA